MVPSAYFCSRRKALTRARMSTEPLASVRAVNSVTRGTVFRITEATTTDTDGAAAFATCSFFSPPHPACRMAMAAPKLAINTGHIGRFEWYWNEEFMRLLCVRANDAR